MSLKPNKKSDMGKVWMKRRLDRPRKIHPEYHLIVTEGEKTEPLYFQTIRDAINANHPGRIHLDIQGEGDHDERLFWAAKKTAEGDPNGYKHIWIVYDTDDFDPEKINKVQELCQSHSTKECKYHAIWSNQCIELWFLLHFSYMHSDLHRDEYFPKLTQCLLQKKKGVYYKKRADMFQVLKPYMKDAIENAKKLQIENEGKTPAASAPGTMVYELIEKLQPYL